MSNCEMHKMNKLNLNSYTNKKKSGGRPGDCNSLQRAANRKDAAIL